MWRTSMRRWSKTRARGMRAWVLYRGVFGWGVPMYVVMSVAHLLVQRHHWINAALIGLPVWLGGGVLVGASSWWMREWGYRRYLRKTGRRLSAA